MPRLYRDQVIVGDKLVIPSGEVVNAVKATGTLTFTDAVTDGEVVAIGGAVYEFDTDSDVTEGNIAVDVSGGATAADAVTALVSAIGANEDSVVVAEAGDGTSVDVTAKVFGEAGNEIATTTDAVAASWAEAKLEGGVDATEAVKGTMFFDADYLYIAVDDCTDTEDNWKKVALT